MRALASSPTPQRRERVETFPDRVRRAGARWRPGRRSGIALVVIAPLAGSAIGGGLAARTTPERAEAVVVVGAGSGPSDANRAAVVRAVVALARTPAMAAAAQEIAASSGERLLAPADVPKDLRVTGEPAAGLVRIDASANTASIAQAVAGAVASQVTFTARRLALGTGGNSRMVVGDFEDASTEWREPSSMSIPPSRARIVHGGARYNSSYLAVTCRSGPGCGPTAHVRYPFRAGTPYVATMWARARQRRVRVAAILGVPVDVRSAHPVALTPSWQRMEVRWTPRRGLGSAEVGVQTRGRGAVSFDLDGVLLSTPGVTGGGSPTAQAEAQAFRAARFADALPARSIGAAHSSRTVTGALVGGAAGLLAGLLGTAAGLAARRRRRE